MYKPIGTMPVTARARSRRQPTRRASMPTMTTTSSGSPTDRTSVAYPMSSPAIAMVSTEGRSLQHRMTTARVARKMNSGSAVIMCSRCSW